MELWSKAGSASLFGVRRDPDSRSGSSTFSAEVAQWFKHTPRTRTCLIERLASNQTEYGCQTGPRSALTNDPKKTVVTQVRILPFALRGCNSVAECRCIIWPEVGGSIPSVPAVWIRGSSRAPTARSEVVVHVHPNPLCLRSSRSERPVLTGKTVVRLHPQAPASALGESTGVMIWCSAGSSPVRGALVSLNISKRSPTGGRRVAETSGTRRMDRVKIPSRAP